MNNLIGSLIKYALILGAAGQLVDATIAMRNNAWKASSGGLISLGALNRSLVGRHSK